MTIKKLATKPWLTSLLKIVIAVGVLTWLVSSGKFDPSSLQKINQPLVWLMGLVLFVVALLINNLRWIQLLAFEKVSLSFYDGFSLTLMGVFFNFVIPGGVGGDVVKCGYLFKRYPNKKWFIGWATLMDRMLGLAAALLYAAVMGVIFHERLGEKLGPSIFTLGWLIIVGFAVGLLAIYLAPRQKIEALFSQHQAWKKIFWPPYFFFHQPEKILVPFLLSFAGQFFIISISIVMGQLVNPMVPFYMYYLLVPIGYLATILPIAPAGVGIGQAAYLYLFATVAGDGELGVLVITFQQVVQFLIGLIGGGIFILYGKKVEIPAHG